MMKKHAYIILAHHAPDVLRTLLRMIRDPRNDVFLHVDSRSHALDGVLDEVRTRKGVTILPRLPVRWGALSIVRAELAAMDYVRRQGSYSRYHILSGVDLPLQGQDFIHACCDIENPEREFVGFYPAERFPPYTDVRMFFMEQYVLGNAVLRKPLTAFREAARVFQRAFRLKRTWAMDIWNGDQWASLTEPAVDCLLSKRTEILKTFRWTFCPDEMFIQTFLMASPLRPRLFDAQGCPNGSKREIDWMSEGRGNCHPHTWNMADFPQLAASENFFARKFPADNPELIRAVEEMVNQRSVPQAGK